MSLPYLFLGVLCMHIVSLNIGGPDEILDHHNNTFLSAIRKQSVENAFLEKLGFVGDSCVESAHGGVDKAVHMFSFDDYSFYEKKAQQKLPIPAFGENITISGYDCRKACVGDILKIGEATLQVSEPTIRCSKIGSSLGLPLMLKWIHEEFRTGFYLRVLEAGNIHRSANVEILEKGPANGSIEKLSLLMFKNISDTSSVSKVLTLPSLSSGWKEALKKSYLKATARAL